MAKIETRYWKRARHDLDKNPAEVIYFATDTNAAHVRAENDPHAQECGFREYSDNVPEQVHNGADRGTAPVELADPLVGKQQAWEALQAWTHAHGDSVAIQDQIAMLELWKHQLCMWATSTMAAQLKPQGNTNNVN